MREDSSSAVAFWGRLGNWSSLSIASYISLLITSSSLLLSSSCSWLWSEDPNPTSPCRGSVNPGGIMSRPLRKLEIRFVYPISRSSFPERLISWWTDLTTPTALCCFDWMRSRSWSDTLITPNEIVCSRVWGMNMRSYSCWSFNSEGMLLRDVGPPVNKSWSKIEELCPKMLPKPWVELVLGIPPTVNLYIYDLILSASSKNSSPLI